MDGNGLKMDENPEPFTWRNPDELKKELAMRGFWYAKGFGACLHALRWVLVKFAYGDHAEKKVDYIRSTIQSLVDLYEAVPLDGNHPDFDLLSSIKRNVFLLRGEAALILQGK